MQISRNASHQIADDTLALPLLPESRYCPNLRPFPRQRAESRCCICHALPNRRGFGLNALPSTNARNGALSFPKAAVDIIAPKREIIRVRFAVGRPSRLSLFTYYDIYGSFGNDNAPFRALVDGKALKPKPAHSATHDNPGVSIPALCRGNGQRLRQYAWIGEQGQSAMRSPAIWSRHCG